VWEFSLADAPIEEVRGWGSWCGACCGGSLHRDLPEACFHPGWKPASVAHTSSDGGLPRSAPVAHMEACLGGVRVGAVPGWRGRSPVARWVCPWPGAGGGRGDAAAGAPWPSPWRSARRPWEHKAQSMEGAAGFDVSPARGSRGGQSALTAEQRRSAARNVLLKPLPGSCTCSPLCRIRLRACRGCLRAAAHHCLAVPSPHAGCGRRAQGSRCACRPLVAHLCLPVPGCRSLRS